MLTIYKLSDFIEDYFNKTGKYSLKKYKNNGDSVRRFICFDFFDIDSGKKLGELYITTLTPYNIFRISQTLGEGEPKFKNIEIDETNYVSFYLTKFPFIEVSTMTNLFSELDKWVTDNFNK